MTSKLDKSDDINLVGSLVSDIHKYFLSEVYSDVIFVSNRQTFPAHRMILAMRSEYFLSKFDVDLKAQTPSLDTIELCVPTKTFHYVLQYIYTGRFCLSKFDTNEILQVLSLAFEYKLVTLAQAILSNRIDHLTIDNICSLLHLMKYCESQELKNKFYRIVDENAELIINNKAFFKLDIEDLCGLLQRNSFAVSEIRRFISVEKWHKHHPGVNMEPILKLIQFNLIDSDNFVKIVRPSGLLSSDKILDILRQKAICKTMITNSGERYREDDVTGSCCVIKNSGKTVNMCCDKCQKFSHDLNKSDEIIFQLRKEQPIDSISFKFQKFTYSYYIEASICPEQKTWFMLVDYSNYDCRSQQKLSFEKQIVRYIKVVGTKSDNESQCFEFTDFSCQYQDQMQTIINGIIAPTENVASNAFVRRGSSQAMLKKSSDFTRHAILTKRFILIHLPQPFVIDTIVMDLYSHCGNTTRYSFYIETSLNCKDWEMAIDCRNRKVGGLQKLGFKARPTVYIKITGTDSTYYFGVCVTKYFACIYFQCFNSLIETSRNAERKNRKHLDATKEVDLILCPGNDGMTRKPLLQYLQQQHKSISSTMCHKNNREGLCADSLIATLNY